MLFFKRDLTLLYYVCAGFVAVTIPMVAGYVIHMANPAACYDSPCVLPLLLMILPPFAAPVLLILFAINRRLGKPLPDGWLPTLLISGVLVQIGIAAFGVLSASPFMRETFFSNLLFFPQGFFVGMVIGVLFWVVLYAFGRNHAYN